MVTPTQGQPRITPSSEASPTREVSSSEKTKKICGIVIGAVGALAAFGGGTTAVLTASGVLSPPPFFSATFILGSILGTPITTFLAMAVGVACLGITLLILGAFLARCSEKTEEEEPPTVSVTHEDSEDSYEDSWSYTQSLSLYREQETQQGTTPIQQNDLILSSDDSLD